MTSPSKSGRIKKIPRTNRAPHVIQDVVKGLKLALATLDNVSESLPVPGAKVCFATALKIWEANDQVYENMEDLDELCKYIEGFRKALEFKEQSVQSELVKRIEEAFAEFQKREEEIDSARKRNWLRRLLYADDDAVFIKKMFRKVKAISEWFQSEAIKNIEEAVRRQEQIFVASKLPIAKDARWSAAECDECVEGTRLTVLRDIQDWIVDSSAPQIFWLTGLAGKGKSTIAKTIARYADGNGLLGASFFCSRNHAARSHSMYIIPTLAEQLSTRFPQCPQFYEAIENNPGIGYSSRSEQLKRLILNPFSDAMTSNDGNVLLIIDALDEVDRDPSQPSPLVLALLSGIPLVHKLKILISSRPEYSIRSELQPLVSEGRIRALDLGDVQPTEVDHDIQEYLRSHLQHTLRFERSSIDACEKDIVRLVERSSQLFIFASTAIKTVRRHFDLHEQLTDIIAYDGIDRLYESILESAVADLSPSEKAKRARLLGILVLLRHPLPPSALAVLSGFTPTHVCILLEPFNSVLVIPEASDKGGVVRIIHQSFRDFLVERCSLTDMRVAAESTEKEISLRLLDSMKALSRLSLDEDNLVLDPTNDPFSGQELIGYACYCWADHLSSTNTALLGNEDAVQYAFNHFTSNYLPQWRAYLLSKGDFRSAADICSRAKSWHEMLGTSDPLITFRIQQFTGLTHLDRGDKFARLDDIVIAIQAFQIALSLPAEVSEDDRANVIRSLADALYYQDLFRFSHENLEHRIAILEGALKLDIRPDTKARLLSSLGLAFFGKFSRVTKNPTDLEESISLRRQALALRPNSPSTLYFLASALSHRYNHYPSSTRDLDEAEELTRKAVSLTSPASYRDMGLPAFRLRVNLLNTKFIQNGDPELLNEAVTLARQAFANSLPAYRYLGWAGCSLIKTLQHMVKQSHSRQDRLAILDEIIETARRTLCLQQMEEKMRRDLRRWLKQALGEKEALIAEAPQAGSPDAFP